MPVRHPASFVLVALLAVSGCYKSTSREGDTPRADAAIVLPDASLVRDASVPRIDAGRDAGPPVGCEREIVGPYAGPGCSPAVSECIMSCGGDEACPDECIGSEPECTRCFYTTLIGCANELGCQREWNDFACCAERAPGCGGGDGIDRLSCVDACPTQFDEYSICLNRIPIMECLQQASDDCLIAL